MSNIIDSIQLSGVTYTIQGSGGGGVPESTFTAYTAATDARIAEDEEVTAAGLNALNEAISGVSGNNVVELTQAEYEALVTGGTVDPTAFYIITDATAGDLTQYWTSAQTQSAITSAVSGKVDKSAVVSSVTSASTDSEIPTAKAVYDAVGSGGGGGKAIEAGRGISITTGETADTVSFSLPISAGTGTDALIMASDTYAISDKAKGHYSVSLNGGSLHPNYAKGNNSLAEGLDTRTYGSACHSEGYGTKAGVENDINIKYAHAEGERTEAKGSASHAEGSNTIANNWAEHASGRYNNSVSASTTFGDSGNTLFSVGNGTSSSARHNAFEIRQNGDIYLSLNGQDVKLQDQLGGSSITVDTALDSGSTNPVENRVIYNKIDEVEQVTAAGLNAVNDKFDGLQLKKLTQQQYDALTIKDADTLYIILA